MSMGVEVIVHPYLLGRNEVNWVTAKVEAAPTVRDCILGLGRSLPDFDVARVLDSNGALRPSVYVMLNHKDLPEEGISSTLNDGDCIRLVYIMASCC
jgi:hypothetical protein